MRIAVVSDSHLSPAALDADCNWDAVLAHLSHSPPDLVIHCGDLSAAGDRDPAALVHARKRLDELSAPWRVVPGNHDVGNPWIARETLVEAARRYEDIIGDRFWSFDTAGEAIDAPGGSEAGGTPWRLIGIDSQALATGHPDDERWWEWTAARLMTDLPVAVFQHRPTGPTTPTESETDSGRRYLPEPQRTRFRQLLAASTARLVVSGHVHQWRSEMIDGIDLVWAPSTWASLSDGVQPAIGTKLVGMVEIELGRTHRAELVVPEGLTQVVHRPIIAEPAGAGAGAWAR